MTALPWPHDILLAPLTKGGNLPYRRLCVDFGAQVTCGEMAYAFKVLKGSPRELALLRSHESEGFFGVQIAARKPKVAAEAARIAVDRGARWVDLNCGCPIDETVNKGMGARLLQRTRSYETVLKALVQAVDVPVTAKIRLGFKEGRENALETTKIAEEAGCAAVIVHGRTREQRYSRAADYDAIRELVEARNIPVIGNGDVLTWYEAQARRERSGVAGLMIARGALIKPWIFQELAEGRELCLSAEERVRIYHRLAGYFREHFGDDEMGTRRVMSFLPWHFSFFSRYRPLPEDEWAARAAEHPLMQSREASPEPTTPLEALLADDDKDLHRRIAELLLEAPDADAAVEAARTLAEQRASEGVEVREAGRMDSRGWG